MRVGGRGRRKHECEPYCNNVYMKLEINDMLTKMGNSFVLSLKVVTKQCTQKRSLRRRGKKEEKKKVWYIFSSQPINELNINRVLNDT